MTGEVTAIETKYKGYRFRSRLEARWAVFFDTLDLSWFYEPEGFETKTFGEPIRYLPDFYLPETKTWVEVKGSDESLKEDMVKLESILDFQSPIPGIQESYHKQPTHQKTNGLLILGNIPDPINGLTLHPIIQHHKGLVWSWVAFEPNPVEYHGFNSMVSYFTDDPEEWSIKHFQIKTPRVYAKVIDAYTNARSARFEYGESS